MQDLASIMGQHHEDKEHPKRERRDHEEVDRDELADVIRQKRTPGLGRLYLRKTSYARFA